MKNIFLYAIVFVAFFLTAFMVPKPQIAIDWAENEGEIKYVPGSKISEGRELSVIFIGSSTCDAANIEYLPAVLESIKEQLHNKAKESGIEYSVIGVATDRRVTNGVNYLEKFGYFDEIIVGRSWLNTGALKYVWQDIPGVAGTPSLIVTERMVSLGADGGIQVEEEVLLARKVGADVIRSWQERGAPLPDFSLSNESP